jgi:hypothetical protein
MRLKFFFIIIFVLSSLALAQVKFTDFKVGFLVPSDAKTGFMGGVNIGRNLDENIGTSIGIDVFRRSYIKETEIAEFDIGEGRVTEVAREIDQSITIIPLTFQLHYTGGLPQSIQLKFSGGIGYAMLWNNITNFITKEDKSQFFHGFIWNLSGGASFPLSRASDLFGELYYSNSSPSRDAGETNEGLPVRSEINMSGIGFRIGIRLYGLGFF